jgi:hypothetical protein
VQFVSSDDLKSNIQVLRKRRAIMSWPSMLLIEKKGTQDSTPSMLLIEKHNLWLTPGGLKKERESLPF